MSRRRTMISVATMTTVFLVCAGIFVVQTRAIERKGRNIHAGMTVNEVLEQLEGWSMINTHPVSRRAIPHGTGPELNGYSGEVFVLTPVTPDGKETDLRKIPRAEFERRLTDMLNTGEPWSVYFSYRTIGTDAGVLVRFDGRGRVAAPDAIRS